MTGPTETLAQNQCPVKGGAR